MVHQTQIMQQVKSLRSHAKTTRAALKAAQKLAEQPGVRPIQKKLKEDLEITQAEAAALKASGLQRLEDLNVFEVEKTTKKGNAHTYWHAAWMEGSKVRNVYLGSTKKMSSSEALVKARKIKAQALGIDQPEE